MEVAVGAYRRSRKTEAIAIQRFINPTPLTAPRNAGLSHVPRHHCANARRSGESGGIHEK